jgi:hypothetical protein
LEVLLLPPPPLIPYFPQEFDLMVCFLIKKFILEVHPYSHLASLEEEEVLPCSHQDSWEEVVEFPLFHLDSL